MHWKPLGTFESSLSLSLVSSSAMFGARTGSGDATSLEAALGSNSPKAELLLRFATEAARAVIAVWLALTKVTYQYTVVHDVVG